MDKYNPFYNLQPMMPRREMDTLRPRGNMANKMDEINKDNQSALSTGAHRGFFEMMRHTPWWKGIRGEWYVVIQFTLCGLVAFGPRMWTFDRTALQSIIGAALFLSGGLLIVTGALCLGTNLTAVPYPKEQATLIETGPFQFVRHPMYCGAILMAFGWALWVHSWLTLGYAMMLFVFFDIKSRLEEQWLKVKFSVYAAYQKRVRKLIPFVY